MTLHEDPHEQLKADHERPESASYFRMSLRDWAEFKAILVREKRPTVLGLDMRNVLRGVVAPYLFALDRQGTMRPRDLVEAVTRTAGWSAFLVDERKFGDVVLGPRNETQRWLKSIIVKDVMSI